MKIYQRDQKIKSCLQLMLPDYRGIISLWSLIVHSELRKKVNFSGCNPSAHSPQICPFLPNPNLSEYTTQAISAGNLHIISNLVSQTAVKHLPFISIHSYFITSFSLKIPILPHFFFTYVVQLPKLSSLLVCFPPVSALNLLSWMPLLSQLNSSFCLSLLLLIKSLWISAYFHGVFEQCWDHLKVLTHSRGIKRSQKEYYYSSLLIHSPSLCFRVFFLIFTIF